MFPSTGAQNQSNSDVEPSTRPLRLLLRSEGDYWDIAHAMRDERGIDKYVPRLPRELPPHEYGAFPSKLEASTT